MALDEAGRLLYMKTHNGVVSMPLDRVALATSDENASSEVYVYRETGTAERTILDAGGGANYRDNRNWRVFGLAPKGLGSGNVPQAGLFEITYPTTIKSLRVRVLSGSGILSLKVYNWDGSRGDLVSQNDITITGAGSYIVHLTLNLDPNRFYAMVDSASSINVETIVGLLPWTTAPQYLPFHMSEATL